MRKLLLGVVAGAVMLVAAAIAMAATQTTYEQSYTTSKAHKSAGTHFDTSSIDPDNTAENQQPDKTRKLVIGFPKGTKIKQGVKPYCKNLDESADDPCPKKTQIGSGSAEVRLKFTEGPAAEPIPADVTAYNRKSDGSKGLFLYVVPQAPGQAPVVIESTFKGRELITNLEPLCVLNDCARNGEAVLTKFQLDTKPYKKVKHIKRHGKRRKIKKYFIKTPKCTKAGWTFTADFTYDTGETKHLESQQDCKR